MKLNHQLVAVVGPTGSGKTALAVALAKKYHGVIISADSRQVYRGLDIGTNKEGVPGTWRNWPCREIDGVAQLLVDTVDPGSRFTLHDWLETARSLLKEIWADGHLPIVVGGTGLYVSALVDGYQPGGGRHATSRQPVTFASQILEVDRPRQELYEKSDKRFERVFDEVVVETQRLLDAGVPKEWLERLGLDYRFACYFIDLAMDRALAIEGFQQASRQYIRRQLTWWRHHGPTVKVANLSQADRVVGDFLKNQR